MYLAITESFNISPYYIHSVNNKVLPLKEVQTFSSAILKKYLSALLFENGILRVKSLLHKYF